MAGALDDATAERSAAADDAAADAAAGDSSIDEAFARFARSGDPQALALVFDRSAPRLILIAAHLVDTPADAEDVLQTTFVEAIRSAHRFTPGRPVLPWLIAILARRAANLRRSATRRPLASSSDALEELVDPAAGPADVAVAGETARRISTAVAALPAPFREVLTLHLVHGLRPIEIARALDRPAGSVHAQIHRGLERLRAALPKGLAITVAALLDAPAKAAMRAELLALAKDSVPPTIAAPTIAALGTAIIMKKTIGVVAALLAVVLGITGYWYLAAPDVEIAPGVHHGAGKRSVLAASRSEDDAPTTDGPSTPVEGSRSLLDGETVEAARSAVLTGRIVASETGEPLAGASVRVVGYSRNMGSGPPADWTAPAAVQTGADGRYRMMVALRDDVWIEFYAEAEGRVAVAGSWWSGLRLGLVMDHGDVPMLRGTRVIARIVDENGEPIEGFGIQLDQDRRQESYRCGLSLSGTGIQNSDRHGVFPEWMLPPGHVKVGNDHVANYHFEGPESFHIAPGEVEREIVFRVRRVDPAFAISGRVIDLEGRPVRGMEIGAELNVGGWGGLRVGRSERDGRFAIGPLDPARGPFPLSVLSSAGVIELAEPSEPVAAGTEDLRVVVRRLAKARLIVDVVDAAKRPVEFFAAACMRCQHRDGGSRSGDFTRFPMDHHGGGRIEAELKPGSYLLFVRPGSAEQAPVLSKEIELAPGAELSIQVELAEHRQWVVRTVAADGTPVAGVEVYLRQTVGRGRPSRERHVALEDFLARGPQGTFATLLGATGTTGADGRLMLRSTADLGAAELSLKGPHIVSATHPVGPAAPAQEHILTVAPAAVLEGQVLPAEVPVAWGPSAKRRAEMALLANGDQELLDGMPSVSLVDLHDEDRTTPAEHVWIDGTFRMTGIPAGDRRVVFEFSEGNSRKKVTIGEVRAMDGGETRRASFDVSALRPAVLEGSVLLDGVGVPRGTLLLRGDGRYENGPVREGRFRIGPLRAGSYLPVLRLGASTDERFVIGDSRIILDPGAQLELPLSFVTRILQVTLCDSDGSPLPGRRLSLRPVGEKHWFTRHIAVVRTTDGSGMASFEHVPQQPLEVLLWPEDVPPLYRMLPEGVDGTVVGTIDAVESAGTTKARYAVGR